MPRVPLSLNQKIDYKLMDMKTWVCEQMVRTKMNQTDVGNALGISQPAVSAMLKRPGKKKDKVKDFEYPFTLRQVLLLCELFEVDAEERKKLLML